MKDSASSISKIADADNIGSPNRYILDQSYQSTDSGGLVADNELFEGDTTAGWIVVQFWKQRPAGEKAYCYLSFSILVLVLLFLS